MSSERNRPSSQENQAIPAFSPTVDDRANDISGLPTPEYVGSGITLLEQNERPLYVRLIRDGIVKLSHTTPDGEESVLGLRSEGWWMGASLALLNLPSLCEVKTITPCTICNIPAKEFAAGLMTHERRLRHFVSSLCRELLMVQQHSIMQGGSAAERLRYLQGESSQSIWKTVDPTLVMRQNEVAKLLSITPEHLSRLTRRSPSRP